MECKIILNLNCLKDYKRCYAVKMNGKTACAKIYLKDP
jgi:hypothetical protein